MSSSEFSTTDARYLLAAQGWIELGDWRSADEELGNIPPRLHAHPDMLKLRVEICSVAKKWDEVIKVAGQLVDMSPDDVFGHVRLAYGLHELKRTQEAFDALFPVATRFPSEWVIPYNLACYSAQLGDLAAARDWLAQAFRLGNAKEIQAQAMDDPDLAPLWSRKGKH